MFGRGREVVQEWLELAVEFAHRNLSVEGDESYVAGNVTAHNCTDYCPEYALEETIEYDIAEYTRELLVWSPERLARPPAKKDDSYVFSVDTSRGAGQVRKKED